MIPLLRHFVGWLVGAFRSPRRLHARESGTASATAGSPCPTTSATTGLSRQGVLGRSPKALVWVEETAPAGHPRNGGALASHGLPLVLVLAVADSTRRRKETLEPGSAPADFPHGRRESDVGCVKKTRNCHAVRKMEVDPPEPPCRRRLQTAISCCGPMTMVVNVMVKRRDSLITSSKDGRDECKRTADEASKGS